MFPAACNVCVNISSSSDTKGPLIPAAGFGIKGNPAQFRSIQFVRSLAVARPTDFEWLDTGVIRLLPELQCVTLPCGNGMRTCHHRKNRKNKKGEKERKKKKKTQ